MSRFSSASSASSAPSVQGRAFALSLALAVALVAAGAAGCGKPAPQSGPPPDSAADVLTPPPQLAAIDAALMAGTWHWVGTIRPTGTLAPKDPSRYTIAFGGDSTVSVQLDCNGGGGRYQLFAGQRIDIGPIEQTLMGCPEGSLDTEFSRELQAAEAYHVTGDTLAMTLELAGGTMRFVRRTGG